MFIFPRTKFVDENGIIKQLIHVDGEVTEAWQSALSPDIQHTAEEVMDCLHSCETALRILSEKHGIDLVVLRDQIEEKNRKRGYYETPLDKPD